MYLHVHVVVAGYLTRIKMFRMIHTRFVPSNARKLGNHRRSFSDSFSLFVNRIPPVQYLWMCSSSHTFNVHVYGHDSYDSHATHNFTSTHMNMQVHDFMLQIVFLYLWWIEYLSTLFKNKSSGVTYMYMYMYMYMYHGEVTRTSWQWKSLTGRWLFVESSQGHCAMLIKSHKYRPDPDSSQADELLPCTHFKNRWLSSFAL